MTSWHGTKWNNFTCIEDIISIKDDGFENLQIIDKKNKKTSPIEPLLLRLRIVKAFYYHLKEKHNLDIIDWKDESVVTSEIFDEFRVSVYNPSAPTKPGVHRNLNLNQNNKTNQLPQNKPAKSLASEFRKGIRREKSAYSVLKDEHVWNSWKRKTIATMNAHGCQNIANPNYKPQSLDKTLLLREQNNFMYDVFATILQTTMGIHYVSIHEDDRDAQLVWKLLHENINQCGHAYRRIDEFAHFPEIIAKLPWNNSKIYYRLARQNDAV